MCGICGDVRFDGGAGSVGAVGAMAGAMAGRGPDGEGVYGRGAVALGHRRLKIIDLSEAAGQPMVDSELGLVLVYNGAVYNYQELRRELEGKGYRFFSTGDTEVVLKAYHAWGERCVERLNGMFAFAVWERDGGRVFVARDRLGIKPLYYSETGGRLRFASTLPALLAGDRADRAGGGNSGGRIDTSIDPVALHYYMTLHAVVPAPHTILKGVRKLPPASTMMIERDGKVRLNEYWRAGFNPDPELARYSLEDWKRRLLDELGRAIDRRMIADVPVGVLLSGGLDSSLVVGMLAKAGQSGLNTFSIGFESVGDVEGDEFRYSDVVAERFGTTHHKIRIGTDRLLGSVEGCVRAMSEPMVSHDCIGFYLLSQEVSKHVKVVQSGQGADEVFAGYHWYPPLMNSQDAVGDYTRGFFDSDHAGFAEAVEGRWVGEDHSRRLVDQRFAQAGADAAIDKALRLDTTVMLVDDPVKRVDNMTMAWGLEGRVPFLDHELVEFAGRVPARLKVEGGGKYVLKEAARAVIPGEVIDRPKGYFPVPALKYIKGEYLDWVRGVLGAPAARGRGVFREGYVGGLLGDPQGSVTPLGGSRLWQVALLEYWLELNGV